MRSAILIVDDEQRARDFCAEALTGLGYEAECAESADQALAALATGRFDIVLADVRMPGMSGLELLKIVKQDYPAIDVVMITGFGTVSSAVQAIKQGAYDYLTKPLKLDDLKRVLRRLVEKQELTTENRLLREQLKAHQGFANLVGTSPKMQKVYRMILKVAPKRHPILIIGESGTGKELVARAIHAHSPWNKRPFMPVDCGVSPFPNR